MRIKLLTLIALITPLTVSAECVVSMDARGSSEGRSNSDEAVLCSFGESNDYNAPQPLYTGPAYNNYYGLSPNEERAILRGLNRRNKTSASSGLTQRAVVGATTPLKKSTFLSVNPR